MRVFLLADSVAFPDGWDRSDHRQRGGSLLFDQVLHEFGLSTLVTIGLSLACFRVGSLETEIAEGHSVGQALHHSIEEACVSVVHHAVSNLELWHGFR